MVFSKALFELQYKSGKDPCVVNVTIKLNFISGGFPAKEFKDRPGYRAATDAEIADSITAFQQGITATWSDKFQLCCKKVHGYTKVQGPHSTEAVTRERHNTCCPIRIIIENNKSGDTVGVFTTSGQDSSQNNWNMTDPGFTRGQTAAHEIGHFLGNTEEYGKTTKVRGPIIPYGQPILDPTSVMGAKVGTAYKRHFWRILKAASTTAAVFEGASLKPI